MNRYLLDENLPATLATLVGGDCRHAGQIGLQPTDDVLWRVASEQGRTILTKDTDFFQKILLEGSPPKIVWFRIGNLRRIEMELMVVRIWPAVENLLNTCDLVEVHTNKLEGIRLGAE